MQDITVLISSFTHTLSSFVWCPCWLNVHAQKISGFGLIPKKTKLFTRLMKINTSVYKQACTLWLMSPFKSFITSKDGKVELVRSFCIKTRFLSQFSADNVSTVSFLCSLLKMTVLHIQTPVNIKVCYAYRKEPQHIVNLNLKSCSR